ncbi:TniQ family protein [Kitasatospora sp. NPDC056138]|uniref:TniQ family protein n=1 Tax=Kitasatospora sp. NPDC056138 TaxID=3345724 RepID=UPI0035DF1B78
MSDTRNAHQAPARSLPIPIRPWGGESLTSFVQRLAAANRTRDTILWKTIARPESSSLGRHLEFFEALLNPPSAERLAVISGLPLGRLSAALPALGWTRQHAPDLMEKKTPAVRFQAAMGYTRRACPHCAIRRNTAPPRLHLPITRVICARHQHWQSVTISGSWTNVTERPPFPPPVDLSPLAGMAAAQRRLAQILRCYGPDVLVMSVRDARSIAEKWTTDRWAEPAMVQRWQTRAHKLDWPAEAETITQNSEAAAIVSHPEVATLAAFLAPMTVAPTEFFYAENKEQIRALVDRTRAALGLTPLAAAACQWPCSAPRRPADAIWNHIDQVRQSRGRHRWRHLRSAMIPELGIPDPSHQTWQSAARHSRVRHDQ